MIINGEDYIEVTMWVRERHVDRLNDPDRMFPPLFSADLSDKGTPCVPIVVRVPTKPQVTRTFSVTMKQKGEGDASPSVSDVDTIMRHGLEALRDAANMPEMSGWFKHMDYVEGEVEFLEEHTS